MMAKFIQDGFKTIKLQALNKKYIVVKDKSYRYKKYDYRRVMLE